MARTGPLRAAGASPDTAESRRAGAPVARDPHLLRSRAAAAPLPPLPLKAVAPDEESSCESSQSSDEGNGL